MVKLTAVFESWHIADGNYPPLRRGQHVNLSFEVEPSVIDRLPSSEPDSFVHLGGGEYEFAGTVLRIYSDDVSDPVVVVSCGELRFYMNRSLSLNTGHRVHGRGKLLLDHYLWVEFLDRYPNPPDLFYQLIVERIKRVQIPLSLVAHHKQVSPGQRHLYQQHMRKRTSKKSRRWKGKSAIRSSSFWTLPTKASELRYPGRSFSLACAFGPDATAHTRRPAQICRKLSGRAPIIRI